MEANSGRRVAQHHADARAWRIQAVTIEFRAQCVAKRRQVSPAVPDPVLLHAGRIGAQSEHFGDTVADIDHHQPASAAALRAVHVRHTIGGAVVHGALQPDMQGIFPSVADPAMSLHSGAPVFTASSVICALAIAAARGA